jgi:hypothetical protein
MHNAGILEWRKQIPWRHNESLRGKRGGSAASRLLQSIGRADWPSDWIKDDDHQASKCCVSKGQVAIDAYEKHLNYCLIRSRL